MLLKYLTFTKESQFKIIQYLIIFFGLYCCGHQLSAQAVPAPDENIPFLVTFGKNSDSDWGDDDFSQTFFCLVPHDRVEPFYIRIFDPGTGGEFDEPKGEYDTKVKFMVFGGNGCWSNIDAQGINPEKNYKSGILMASKTFGNEVKYDNNWYTFGPFNPFEGEYVEKFGGRVFKIIADGVSGDDGNLYRYFLSTIPNGNNEVEGGNFFTYEYTFRLANDNQHVSQIYPYVDDKATSVKVLNFDWDNDGEIRIISVAKNGLLCDVSSEGDWSVMEFPITEEEKNTSIEVQFIKNKSQLVENNNVCVIVQNQYGVSLPFYVIPIGGVPVYNPKIQMIQVDD